MFPVFNGESQRHNASLALPYYFSLTTSHLLLFTLNIHFYRITHELGEARIHLVEVGLEFWVVSVAIGDAVASINAPCIEVHISNIYAREVFRHNSFLSSHCKAVISGAGLPGYLFALQLLTQQNI